MIKRIGIVIFCVLVVLMVTTMPVLAIANPDTPPAVRGVYVYEDLLEDDDIGVLIDYYLDYDTLPTTEMATESYLASFVDTDGTTQLGTVAPYTFHFSGYRRGLIWIYFTAAEVDTYNISSANVALHKVWLMGNPTVPSGWTGDPPKTVADIDYWQTTGDSATLLALRILYFADVLELFWELPMIEETALGSRLTSTGESYFENVITNLRIIAPGCFSVSTVPQVQEDLDYSTVFGATMTDGTGTVTDSPIPLEAGVAHNGTADAGSSAIRIIDAELTQADDYWNGALVYITETTDGLAPEGDTAIITDFIDLTNELQFVALSAAVDVGDTYIVDTGVNNCAVTATGTFTLELENGTVGIATSDVGTVTGSSAPLVAGTNTIMVTVIGNIIVTVNLVDTQTEITDTITGTGLDLTAVAAEFGMSRAMFSGLVWMGVTVLICAAVYKGRSRVGYASAGSGKTMMIVFDLCIIGGVVLGLLPILVAVLLFIGFGMLTAYVLFYRHTSF